MFYCVVLCYMVLNCGESYFIARYCFILLCMVVNVLVIALYGFLLFCIVVNCVVLCYLVFCCGELCLIALYCVIVCCVLVDYVSLLFIVSSCLVLW